MAAILSPELVAVAFAALAPEEQEQAFARITDVRLTRLAGGEGETAEIIRSLRRVADCAGGELTPNVYRQLRRDLVASGEEIADFNAVSRHFGSWRKAKEALGLAEVTTPRKIEARFRSRLLGKPHHFREAELEQAMRRCTDDVGRVPLLAEYDKWRQRELELAHARGDSAHQVPSPSAFRRRFGSWEKTLLAFGYSPAEVYVRLEPPPERRSRLAKVDRYTDETLSVTLMRCADELGYVPLVADFAAWRKRELNRTRARQVVFPSDSPYRHRYGDWERALRHFGFSAEAIVARRRAGRERSNASLRQFGFGPIS
jgi:hypothetical protein